MQISHETFNTLFMCAIAYLVARKLYDKFREAQGIEKPSTTLDLRGMFGPYLKAVVAGAAFVFVMWEFIPGSPIEDMARDGLSSWMVRFAVLMSIIPLVMITTPFILLAGLAVRALKVRRGVADVLTGMIGATLGPLGSALFGPQSMELTQALAFIAGFPFAGAVGGFVFWRAMGYPGVAKSTARSVERTRTGAEAVSEAAGGSVLGVGMAAHALLRNETQKEGKSRPARGHAQNVRTRKGFGKRAT